jgi:Raf kinase inhibitor-like YbhB/YbcL family protein
MRSFPRILGWTALSLATAAAPASAFTLSSPAFEHERAIPAAHGCDDANVSPPLVWSEVPDGTKSFALVVDDPDAPAGTFVHWVLYEIAAETRELPRAVPAAIERPGSGMKQGRNDFRDIGYGGPCPPPGAAHRYVFRLYALDDVLGLAPGAAKGDLLAAMRGHVLAEATLVGTFARGARSAPGAPKPSP